MRTHSICLYKKVNKKYTGCNLKTTEFHECALIGVCAVIRSNMVFLFLPGKHTVDGVLFRKGLPETFLISIHNMHIFRRKKKTIYFLNPWAQLFKANDVVS